MRILRSAGRVWTGVLLVTVLLTGLLLLVRLALPLIFATTPELRASYPIPGATDIPPRTQLTLEFSTPMNPRSVERALRLEPPAATLTSWNPARTTLTISPTTPLRPETDYLLTIGADAQSRMFRPLAAPARLTFRTAPAPAVVAVLPTDMARDVALDQAIALTFSRPMVGESALRRRTTLPALRFEPPLEGSVTWLSPTTALFQPADRLLPGVRYRATLDQELADLAGAPLGAPFGWSFSTPAPSVISTSPGDAERNVGLREPLVIRLSQLFEPAAIERSLTISPTIAGVLASAPLPDGSQVVTFTPGAGWAPDTSYRALIAAGAVPAAGNLSLEESSISFHTAPVPRVIGRFPGEGQILSATEEIRLVFNTPVDAAALQAALRFQPPADDAQVSTTDSEARITAGLVASTAYTLTLPADLVDRNGAALGQEYRFRFVTAPAAPALQIPGAEGHTLRRTPGTAEIAVRRVNLSTLNFDLYQLDEATVVRTAAFDEEDWRAFSPERYGQPLLHSWSAQLSDPLNEAAESPLPLRLSDGRAPEQGSYYLRVRSPEGPRADMLLLVSSARLALQRAGSAALVWSYGPGGSPIAGLPIALYQDGALLQRGTTGPDGAWLASPPGGDPRRDYLAVAGGDAPALAVGGQAGAAQPEATPRYRAFLTTDRGVYRPGDEVRLAGFARVVDGSNLRLPPAGTSGTLSGRRVGSAVHFYEAPITLSPTGAVGGRFLLPADSPPGEYVASVAIGDQLLQRSFEVRSTRQASMQVAVESPARIVAGATTAIRIAVTEPGGLPLPGVVISWTISVERAGWPTLDGYTLGDPERLGALPPPRRGSGQTGPDGVLEVPIAATEGDGTPLRYRIVARAAESAGPTAEGVATLVAMPGRVMPALRLPTQVWTARSPGQIELLALDGGGEAVPDAPVRVEVLRRTWPRPTGAHPPESLKPTDERVLVRSLRVDDDGHVTLPLTLDVGGEYRVVARAGDGSEEVTTAASLWVAAPGATDWRPQVEGRVALIPDRDRYRPGETAQILPASPFGEATALLMTRSGDVITGTVQALRAGDLLAAGVPAGAGDSLDVTLTLVERRAAPAVEVRAGDLRLPVVSGARALTVTIDADRESYAPGATAILTLTASDEGGRPMPADVALVVAGVGVTPAADITRAFEPTPHSPVAAPAQLSRPPAGERETTTEPPVVMWSPSLRVGDSGTLTVTIQLPPDAGALEVTAWAAAAERFGQAHRTLELSRTLDLRLSAPARIRQGDSFEVSAVLRNTTSVTQAVELAPAARGAQLGSASAQRIELGPDEQSVVRWQATAGGGPVELEVTAAPDEGEPTTDRLALAVAPARLSTSGGGGLVADRLSRPIAPPQPAQGALVVEVAPSERALARGIAEALAARSVRSTLDDAALLIASTAVTDTQPLGQEAVRRLAAAQRGDGGWGWWPGEESHPFVTLFVAEALLRADLAGLEVPGPALERSIAVAQSIGSDAGQPASLRTQAEFVLSLAGRADAQILAALAAGAGSLDVEALSYLLLAREPDPARDAPLRTRLGGLVRRDADGAFWTAAPAQAGLSTTTSASALAALALRHADSASQLLPDARGWLAASFRPGAWPTGYESARAAAALLALAPEPGRDPSYVVTLDGVELLKGGQGAAARPSTSRVTVPASRLRPDSALTVLSSGGEVVVGYRLEAPATALPGSRVAMLREYLDPATGEPLDGAALTPGQLVRVRLTLVNEALLRWLVVDEPLPGGLNFGAAEAGPLTFAGLDQGEPLFAAEGLEPGVYQQTYTARAVAPGRFIHPPAVARALESGPVGTSEGTEVAVASPP